MYAFMILPLISPSQLGVFLSKKLNVAQYVEPDTDTTNFFGKSSNSSDILIWTKPWSCDFLGYIAATLILGYEY